jgi:putative membrane protein
MARLSADGFSSIKLRDDVTRTVASIEAKASVEIVVSLRRESGGYRDADLAFGALTALVTLVVMLFAAREFSLLAFPGGSLATFVAAALLAPRFVGIRRFFTTSKRRARAVRAHAREAFVDVGASRTHHRRAVLIYVSLLEQTAEIVADVGLDSLTTDDAYKRATEALQAAVHLDDAPAFVASMATLGDVIAAKFPREAGDTNELPDAPDAPDTSDEGGAT